MMSESFQGRGHVVGRRCVGAYSTPVAPMQTLLGHAKLETPQLYAESSPAKLLAKKSPPWRPWVQHSQHECCRQEKG
jgi:hypothetical protein